MGYINLVKKALRSPVSYLLQKLILRLRQYYKRLKPHRRITLASALQRKLSERRPPFPTQLINTWIADATEDNEMIRAADLICENYFGFFGSGPVALGRDIDWHYDFINKKECPREHISQISYAYTYDGKDIKVPWELSRFQFLSTLARAYNITKIEKYAEKGASLILDWIAKNPVEYGINWRCPMDLAIQICNWLAALYQFEQSPAWQTPEFREKLFTSLAEHGCHIFENLEYGPGWNSNHFLSDVVGLLFLSTLVPEFREAKKWKKFALDALEKEMRKQVYDDGADFEGSIPYHRLVTELFGFSALLCREHEIQLSGEFMDRLEKMFEFAWYYTKPNGLAPQIGDADDGRLFILDNYFDWNRQDHSHLFQLTSELFPLNKKFEQNEKTQKTSRAFHDTGIYIMRSPQIYCIVDAGPNGQNGNGGHGHNDTLSFELSIGEDDFIVDPGTHVYTANPAERNHFRSTRMHNTVMIDGEEMNRFRDETLFSMTEDVIPILHRWDSDKNEDVLDALHTGYERLGVQHRRVFLLDKRKNRLEITDSLLGPKSEKKHTFEWNFHFAHDIEVTQHNEKIELEKRGSPPRLQVILPESLAHNAKIRDDYISPSYGVKHKAKVLTITYKSEITSSPFIFRIEIA